MSKCSEINKVNTSGNIRNIYHWQNKYIKWNKKKKKTKLINAEQC